MAKTDLATIEPLYYEHDCTGNCDSPNGCTGHFNEKVIVGLTVGGIDLYLDTYMSGDPVDERTSHQLRSICLNQIK